MHKCRENGSICVHKAAKLVLLWLLVSINDSAIYLFIYLFNDNLATGGSLSGAILSCHVEL